MKVSAIGLLLALTATAPLFGEVKHETVRYKHGETQLQGYLAWDDAVTGPRPGVLVVHEWWGLNDYARSRADKLAKMGYVAFALDMYGEGKTTEHPSEAKEWATQVRSNQDQWQERAILGLNMLKKDERVDTKRLAAIGYCFGGSTVLQLAFTGQDVKGVVSFHGALPIPTAEQAAKAKASILVCHGADDPFIPEETIQKFRAGLTAGNVDWQMVYYANARHSFTNPDADSNGIDGLKYNAKADTRSWKDMQQFFAEVIPR